ncbi:MAG: patatin-like phospholipase family protein, partial [Chthoniobacteraceae bacterium]
MQSETTNEAAREARLQCLSGVLRDECVALDRTAPSFDPEGTESERLRAIVAHIDQHCPERSALCLSGGGIRSATFGFGVIQRLAQAGLLTKFDFLSSVSGGGYLGSFLSAWAKTHPNGQAGVERELAGVSDRPIEEPEPKPVRHLRRFSNYVSPTLGLFSADTWALIATALRNLFLNWSVLVVGIAALLVIPWFGLLGVLGVPTSGQLFLLLGLAILCFAVASGYPGLDLPSFENYGLRQRWFLGFWLAPLFLGIICLVTCWAGVTNGNPSSLIVMAMPEAVVLIRCFFVMAGLLGIVLAMGITLVRKRKTLRAYVPTLRLRRTIFVALVTIAFFAYPIPYFIQLIALKLFPAPAGSAVQYMMLAPALLLLAFATLNALFVGLTSRCFDDDDREWWARARPRPRHTEHAGSGREE